MDGDNLRNRDIDMRTVVANRTAPARGTRKAGGLQNVGLQNVMNVIALRISALGAACALAATATGAALYLPLTKYSEAGQ